MFLLEYRTNKSHYVSFKNDDNKKSSVRDKMSRNQVIAFFKPRCSDFLTEDVINNNSFISGMAQSLPKINEFVVLENIYSSGQAKKSTKTALSQDVDEVKKEIQQFDEKLKEVSQVNVDVSQGTELLCISSMQKQALLTQVLTKTIKIRHLIESRDVIRKMNKCVLQQCQQKTNVRKDVKDQ